MVDELKGVALFHVWVHSHAETGQPLSIDVFEISGRVHMQWYSEALEPESEEAQRELAEQFYKHLGLVEASGWFVCRMGTEDATQIPEHFVEVLGCLPVVVGELP